MNEGKNILWRQANKIGRMRKVAMFARLMATQDGKIMFPLTKKRKYIQLSCLRLILVFVGPCIILE